jgi:hypothetical protein
MSNNITNFIQNCLADSARYVLKSDIPTNQIAIFSDNLFFQWQKEVAECADAVRQVVKAEGKRYFVIACSSTFLMEDMRHILESGLGKIAGHAFVYYTSMIYRNRTWKEDLEPEGATIVFEII